MIAPRYINTSIFDQKSVELSKSIHNQKLKKIKIKGSGLYDFHPDETSEFPHIKNRWKSTNSSNPQIVKSELISKQNIKILKKIMNISTQKTSSSRQSFWKKSLNSEVRLKALRKIEQENKTFAVRIASQKPDYITKEIKKNYKILSQFKNRLSRINVLKTRKSRSIRRINWNSNLRLQSEPKSSHHNLQSLLASNEDDISLNEKTF